MLKKVKAIAVFILEDALSVQTDDASIMAVVTLEMIYPPRTDNPPSKSVKIDGKTDGLSQVGCPSKINVILNLLKLYFQIKTY